MGGMNQQFLPCSCGVKRVPHRTLGAACRGAPATCGQQAVHHPIGVITVHSVDSHGEPLKYGNAIGGRS